MTAPRNKQPMKSMEMLDAIDRETRNKAIEGSSNLLFRQLEVGQHWLDKSAFRRAAAKFGYII